MDTEILIIIIILILILLLTYYFNNRFEMNIPSKETFEDKALIKNPDQTLLANISSFLQTAGANIGSQSQANLTPEQAQSNQDLMNQLTSLNSSIKLLIDKQSSNNALSITQSTDLNQIDDLQATQKIQDVYIDKLQSKLSNLEQIYAGYLQKQKQQIQTAKYDKIPVYSSCIVAEANGQYTI